jgi:signal transduction histidine kinase
LHDNINQGLALLANKVQEAEQATAKNQDPVQQKQMQELWQLTNEIATDIQHISHQLHPSKLHYLGLAAAVRDLCREISRQHKLEVECLVRDLPQDLEEGVSLSLFRTVQESLHNVVKHSHARHAKVELTHQSNLVDLRVSDDGIGFNPEEARENHGLGLVSMRERLRSVGGEFYIWSRPSLGTQIKGTVPATMKMVRRGQESVA